MAPPGVPPPLTSSHALHAHWLCLVAPHLFGLIKGRTVPPEAHCAIAPCPFLCSASRHATTPWRASAHAATPLTTAPASFTIVARCSARRPFPSSDVFGIGTPELLAAAPAFRPQARLPPTRCRHCPDLHQPCSRRARTHAYALGSSFCAVVHWEFAGLVAGRREGLFALISLFLGASV